DYTLANNQQVRVDILDANDPAYISNPLEVTSILQNIFITQSGTNGTPNLVPYGTLFPNPITLDPSKYAGKTIVLRFAAVNNKGQLLVGVTGVKLVAKYTDTLPPIITGLVLRNPGFGSGNTTDPTIVGQVNDDNLSPANAFSPPLGEPNNIKKIIFDT